MELEPTHLTGALTFESYQHRRKWTHIDGNAHKSTKMDMHRRHNCRMVVRVVKLALLRRILVKITSLPLMPHCSGYVLFSLHTNQLHTTRWIRRLISIV